MQTHPLNVSGGRQRCDEVRDELLVFAHVLDVYPTGDADLLVVVCSGRPRPAEWERALRTAGYRIGARRRARSLAGADAQSYAM